MPCYNPLEGWRSREKNPSGKRGIVFNVQMGYLDMPVTVPCGQCIGCRLEKSRQWAIRCVHEASQHFDNAFITLTYNDENLPASGSLVKSDFQKFMKRLRKRHPDRSIRYYHCGEYGDTTKRPHYHACLFGIDFPDKKLYAQSEKGNTYSSVLLDTIWGKGFTTLGDVTFESAAYVARYIMKKQNGEKAKTHYEIFIPATGEIIKILPEYTTMSLKPAIGRGWFDKYHQDVFPSDEVIIRGKSMPPPKYYTALQEKTDPDQILQVKSRRIKSAKRQSADNTPQRLAVKKLVKQIQTKQLKRKIL